MSTNPLLLMEGEQTSTVTWSDETIPSEQALNKTFNNPFALAFNNVVALAVLLNNSILLLTLFRTPKLWNSTNAYIASLAAADLLVGFVLVIRCFWIIDATSWVFDKHKYVCMPVVCLLYVSALESITCLALVSLDRYIFIVWPFWYERKVTRRLTATSIFVSWVVCIGIGFLPMTLNDFNPEQGCDPMTIVSKSYLLYCLNLYLFLAEIVISVMYGRVFCVSSQQRRKIEASLGSAARLRARFQISESGHSLEAEAKYIKKRDRTKRSCLNIVQKRNQKRAPSGGGKNCDSVVPPSTHEVSNVTATFSEMGDIEVDNSYVEAGNLQGGEGIHMQYGGKNSGCDTQVRDENGQGCSDLDISVISSAAESVSSRWQVIRFLIHVCGIFFLCWTPLQVIVILYFTVGTSILAVSVGVSMAAINSALNLYVLIAMNKTFKRALLKQLPCLTKFEKNGFPHQRRYDIDFVSDYDHRHRAQLDQDKKDDVISRHELPSLDSVTQGADDNVLYRNSCENSLEKQTESVITVERF